MKLHKIYNKNYLKFTVRQGKPGKNMAFIGPFVTETAVTIYNSDSTRQMGFRNLFASNEITVCSVNVMFHAY
jgi:hypothetical protein